MPFSAAFPSKTAPSGQKRRYIDVGRIEKKQSQLSDLYGALNIGQSIVFVNSRRLDGHDVVPGMA